MGILGKLISFLIIALIVFFAASFVIDFFSTLALITLVLLVFTILAWVAKKIFFDGSV